MQNFNGSALKYITIRTRPGDKCKGILTAGNRKLLCALGRSGIGNKRGEGDGITPRGEFLLLNLMVRRERIFLNSSNFEHHKISAQDGWCDAMGDRNYNRLVKLPYPASHEKLLRDDHLYDIALVMDYNYSRHLGVGGSAIFFHLAHDDYRATEGCVAISKEHMLWLLPHISPRTSMRIL